MWGIQDYACGEICYGNISTHPLRTNATRHTSVLEDSPDSSKIACGHITSGRSMGNEGGGTRKRNGWYR